MIGSTTLPPGSGVLGTNLTVGTTNPGSGVLGTGVTLGTTGTGGVLGTGITVGTTNPGGGVLGTGVTLGTTGTGGVVGTGIVVGTTDPGGGALGTGVTLGTSGTGGTGTGGTGTGGTGTGGTGTSGTGGGTTVSGGDELYGRLNLRLSRLEQDMAAGMGSIPIRGVDTSQRGAPVSVGSNSIAAGFGASATGSASTAMGNGAQASGDGAIAIGHTASATEANSVAIGAGARTTRAGQVAVGNDRSTYTMAGLGSAASRSAQSGPTQFVTSDASGNMATSNYGPSSIAALDGRVGSLETSVGRLQRDMRGAFQGTAIALALTGAVLPEGKNFAVSTNFGTYRGETGFGASGIARVTDNVFVSGGIGVAATGQSNIAGRGGVTVAW